MTRTANKPLVTIAIPTYNSSDRFLAATLKSALAQNYERVEILVSDNASTDSTTTLVQSLADSRVKYVRHQNNLGPNGNFNFCLDAASGDYFLLLHDDDLLDPDFVTTCIDRSGGSANHSFVRTGTRIIDADGTIVWERENDTDGHSLEGLYRSWFADRSLWYFCSTLFNTAALRDVGGFHSLSNDLIDGYALVRLAPRRDWLDVRDVKASIRRSADQLTTSVPVEGWCRDYLGLLDMMCEQIDGSAVSFREHGFRAFGRRCRGRAESQPTLLGRLRAGITVARFFGPRFFPWRRLLRFK